MASETDNRSGADANESSPPSFSAGRRWNTGFHVGVSVVAALAIVVMANYLAARHFVRWKWVGESQPALSAQTLGVLHSLTNQIRVTVFFDREAPLYGPVVALLNDYQAACAKIKVQKIDYLREPAAAEQIKQKYRLSFPETKVETFFKDLVIFDNPGRPPHVVYERQLSQYDLSGLAVGKTNEIKRSAFLGEVMFTSAIIDITEAQDNKAYFLTGHGEGNPRSDDAYGFAKFAAILGQNSVTVAPLSLVGTNGVPADCKLLIIAGPKENLPDAELGRVDQYLRQGGRLLALLGSQMGQRVNAGLDKMLGTWGIEMGDDLVLDRSTSYDGSGLNFVVTNYSVNHPIVRPLFERQLLLVCPRSVGKRAAGKSDPDAPKLEELASTSSTGEAITEFRDGTPLQMARDRRGCLPLMVALEKGKLPGVSGDRTTTRMVVAGDSLFLANTPIDSLANRDFAVLAVNWLLDRARLMGGIGPRPVHEYQLILTQAQMRWFRWLMLVILPGGALGLGGLIWLRRRH
jgi:hypothetical protein